MTDFGGHVQLSLTPALSQNAEHRRGRSFSKGFEGKETYMEFSKVWPKRNPDNPDVFSLCKRMPRCSAYAGALCACCISSRSAQLQQTCFGKQPAFHAAQGERRSKHPFQPSTKPPNHIVINQGLDFAPPQKECFGPGVVIRVSPLSSALQMGRA